MILLNLKTKHILLIVVIYKLIMFLGVLIIFPISEFFYTTELTYNFQKEYLGIEPPYNFFNYSIIIYPINLFCALFFSNKVKEKTIKLKSYLEDKVEDKKLSHWNEQQFNKWTKRIYGKFGLIILIIGFFLMSTVIFISFFPYKKFHLLYIPNLIIYSFITVGFSWGLIIWILFFCFGTAKIISDLCKSNLKVNPFHNDKVGGLKPIGSLSLWNSFNLSMQIGLIILYFIFTNLAGFTHIFVIIQTYLVLILGIFFSFAIFYYPIKNMHISLIKLRTEESKKIESSYFEYYSSLESVNGEEKSKVLLNLLALQSIKNELNEFRDYPWDTKIFIKLFSTYLIPIIVFIINQVYGMGI